ncbi:PAS domain-containing protein [Methylobacterium sp. 37f]|uniref:PAS domain-containing protein n=1 Tax=Methylobacterium sp. 37f TaxID=2817058 RepID=UPI001FFC8F5A|nr:PAS domain-containing protein [Methylobacterium sp. 37f]MCK2052517.1 PAS domain-containing protein [Methylobacterium sp. 37f]
MNVDDLVFSSGQFLNLIESQGVTGTWGWRFADNQHVWSPGLFHVVGLDAQSTRPSYDRLVGLIHPEDRERVQTSFDLIHGVTLGQQTLRVLRPDNTIRVVSARTEIYLGADGRPRGAAGVVLDVTDQERLREARITEQQRRRALFRQTRTLTFSNDPDYAFSMPQEASELTGLPLQDISADAFLSVVREEREHWRGLSIEGQRSGLVHVTKPVLYLAGDDRGRFEVFTVPIRDAAGVVVDWSSLTRPIGSHTPLADDRLREGLEQAIDGRHLRAARALLDWSMTDLAQAAGLSLSTVKRMEENVDRIASQSRHRAMETLRRFGIRFSLMDGGVIGVSAT